MRIHTSEVVHGQGSGCGGPLRRTTAITAVRGRKVGEKHGMRVIHVIIRALTPHLIVPSAPPVPPDAGGSGERNGDGSEAPHAPKHAKMLLRD